MIGSFDYRNNCSLICIIPDGVTDDGHPVIIFPKERYDVSTGVPYNFEMTMTRQATYLLDDVKYRVAHADVIMDMAGKEADLLDKAVHSCVGTQAVSLGDSYPLLAGLKDQLAKPRKDRTRKKSTKASTIAHKPDASHVELIKLLPKAAPLVGIRLDTGTIIKDGKICFRLNYQKKISVKVTITGSLDDLTRCKARGYAIGEFSHDFEEVGSVRVCSFTIAVQCIDDRSTHFVDIVDVGDQHKVATDMIPLHHLPNTFVRLVEYNDVAEQPSKQRLAA